LQNVSYFASGRLCHNPQTRKKLKNHIFKNNNGVKILDDNAVNFLKPKKISTEMYNSACEENNKLRIQNILLVSDNENLQKHISAIESQMQKEKTASESFRSDSNMYFHLSQEKDKRISELENRISDITALVDEKNSRISDLEREIASLKVLCDSQKSEITALKDKCSELKEALAEAKVSKGIFGLGKR
jgi:chromosome segregation ATPase